MSMYLIICILTYCCTRTFNIKLVSSVSETDHSSSQNTYAATALMYWF